MGRLSPLKNEGGGLPWAMEVMFFVCGCLLLRWKLCLKVQASLGSSRSLGREIEVFYVAKLTTENLKHVENPVLHRETQIFL